MELRFEVDGLCRAVAKDVGIAVRKDHDLTGANPYRFTTLKTGNTSPFREQVVNDHMSA